MESDAKVNEHFKRQFKALQEHQQRRLQNLMERKKGKQSSQKGGDGNAEETFGSQNDLNLFETGQPENDDVSKRLLEAENEQLQDQLREVRDENGRLYKLVREKDFEIKQLQKKIQEDKLALSGTSGLAGDIAATKIVELAKKNREITAETESEKAKVKQLNNKVKELERELQTAMGKIHSLGGGDSGIKQSTLKMIEGNLAESPEVKALQEKLTTANFKVMEYRNQLQSTKQELKMTQKLLANEVGEDVNIQSLLTASGSWRGRAQQILVLQGKVRELENRLSQNKSRTSSTEIDDEFLALTDPRKLSAQEKNLLKIRSLEKEKKEVLEKLTGEHDALQKDHEEVKKKLDASKARNKVLCSEVKTLKGQIVTLLEKGKHDDELIDALLSQQKQMQEILMHLSQQDEKNKESQQMPGQHLNTEAQKQSFLIEQLKQMVAEREAKVKELEEEIGQLALQNKSTRQGDSLGAAGTPSFDLSEDTSFTLLRTLASGSDQVGRTGSARTVSKMGHTLVESAATKPSLSCNNITPGRLAGTDSPDLKVLQTQIAEHKALCQAAEVERNRLLELVTVLQKRVEEGNDKVLEAEKKLQEERRRCVILEQQLEKLKMDPGKNTSAQKPPLRSKADQSASQSRLSWNMSDKELSAAQLSKLPLESQIQDLSTRLVMQLDENEALKAALETAVRMKEEDFKLYQDTMDQVKEIFLRALRQQKQEKN
ncbi:coiled-coil domain-containing protein 13 isoform X1 [Apteryx rowi]|uniref:coiled-coil domain-containing protein 13 isoform X1 n=1 Tax=Apteryx rowi TaxID=308060 RepID=UPI000E1CDC9D|nr:coiled-coil domain-containing protein 13 isoform X1 [Apteryx rowi]XP_025927976.1 coiled-coil domain-containing protein 13 isoform X1 [Apteryx rowi]XP_025927985.1 coiled-coil domain-containing protein 13 isoform X1 [Apteryx rowi]XP_025927995.1 coiled-coil domain-containing protein 13 isoform X1 [Apteryx rowi]XP_025928002.1 coiled-coil domain-containing protein 13 isoform X1 [Apteryx rowi]